MNGATGDRIDSWKEISKYLQRDVSTVIRWEKEKGLPVHRIPGGQRQGVFAYQNELDTWLAGPGTTNGVVHNPANESGTIEAPGLLEVPDPKAPAFEKTKSQTPLHVAVSIWTRPMLWGAGILTTLLLVAATFIYIDFRFSFSGPQLSGQQQLTANGQEKNGVLTDGKNVYFGQEQDGWYALAKMPVDGGPIRVLWSPHASVLPEDLSPDGRRVLALTRVGQEGERELWVVPLDKGEPHRLSNITAHSAVWAPDGKTIAYATGNGIYLTSESESTSSEIGSFNALPMALLWSQDGQSLTFVLEDIATGKARLWGQLSGDGMRTITLRPLPPTIDSDGTWRRGYGADAYFAPAFSLKLGSTPVWLVQCSRRWWAPPMQIAPVDLDLGDITGIASARKSSRLFVLSKPPNRVAFESFDPRTQGFRQLLPGVSANYLDYSRDGEWIAYVAYQEGSLWISRADGSGARRLVSPPENVELPRWSPDGKQIAYMVRRTDHPWRIYLMQLDTGATREASEGNDNQGAPTWSPDGKFLTYGNVKCEETHSCAIHRIDLATGKVQTLPDSEGLVTARWSPDGRIIAALQLERHQLVLFDVRAGKWHTLADAINSADLSWSSDSKSLYTNIPGTDARILRIRVADGHQQTVLDIHALDTFDMAETGDLQFSLAPDNSVILHRGIHSQEIYSYDLRGW